MIKIIAFEGFLSFYAGFVRRGLLEPLDNKYPGKLSFEHLGWTKIPKTKDPDIVIGHSFGAKSAMDFFSQRPLSKNIPFILTLDTRSWIGDFGYKFISPAPYAFFHTNIYRKGFMPGYEVENANNIQIPNCGHLNVPFQPEVFKEACKMVERIL